ncbi:hypothetical protein ACFYUL_19220 [Streptomyces sp. NPDC004311]|uniref:hypothetical protein n=1 Tax=Streptomyces sp. NPDC004311 TaxID=3364698 RepID=UPI0036A53407
MSQSLESDDVVGVITQQIEAGYGMTTDELRAAVTAAPGADPGATTILRWYGHLTDAQEALTRAEDALVAELGSTPGELDDPAMALAHQVNAAVAVRDGRAMVVRYLLDGNAPGNRAAWSGPSRTAGLAPALRATPVARPAVTTVPLRGVVR